MGGVESVENIVLMIFEPPGLPDLFDTPHLRRTVSELLSVLRDHPGPVARVGTAGDTAGQLIEEDGLAGKYLLEKIKYFSLLSTRPELRC